MAATTVGKLNAEDLARWRLMQARDDAIRLAPSHYSRSEIEDAYLRRYQLYEDIVERYGIDDARVWDVSAASGVIIYGEWE